MPPSVVSRQFHAFKHFARQRRASIHLPLTPTSAKSLIFATDDKTFTEIASVINTRHGVHPAAFNLVVNMSICVKQRQTNHFA